VHLEAVANELEALAVWTPEAIEAAVRALAERLGTKAGTLIHPARVALTGRAVSPGLFDVLHLLGRPKSVERLRRGADIVRHDGEMPRPAAAPASGFTAPASVPAGLEPASDVEIAGADWTDERPSDDA
jgi:hypothetical protein